MNYNSIINYYDANTTNIENNNIENQIIKKEIIEKQSTKNQIIEKSIFVIVDFLKKYELLQHLDTYNNNESNEAEKNKENSDYNDLIKFFIDRFETTNNSILEDFVNIMNSNTEIENKVINKIRTNYSIKKLKIIYFNKKSDKNYETHSATPIKNLDGNNPQNKLPPRPYNVNRKPPSNDTRPKHQQKVTPISNNTENSNTENSNKNDIEDLKKKSCFLIINFNTYNYENIINKDIDICHNNENKFFKSYFLKSHNDIFIMNDFEKKNNSQEDFKIIDMGQPIYTADLKKYIENCLVINIEGFYLDNPTQPNVQGGKKNKTKYSKSKTKKNKTKYSKPKTKKTRKSISKPI